MKKLTFKKGIHPHEFKELSEKSGIEVLPIPPKVIIPLRQHLGAPVQPLVAKGDRVKTGQIIADAEAFVSAPVHSSVTGTVKSIGLFPTPLSPSDTCIEIGTEPEDDFDYSPSEISKIDDLSGEEILKRIRKGGIVGMGGAAFPAAVKLSPPKDVTIDTIILNGCECEPYLTSDHRSMLEFPKKIIKGLEVIMKATGAQRGIVGIEKNKPDAIKAMTEAAQNFSSIKIQGVQTKYPQGAEKMLIDALINRRVPPGQLPFHVGVVVSNVGTAAAIYDAVIHNTPLYQRVVTFTGDALQKPGNFMVRIGTSLQFVFDHLGGFSKEVNKIISGGPMMGIAQSGADVPITKASSGILALGEQKKHKEYNCINCCKCVYHCPMFLVPTKIVRFAKGEIWDKSEEFGAMNCIECGSCSFVCPSNIPLVQWIRVAKNRLTEIKRASGN